MINATIPSINDRKPRPGFARIVGEVMDYFSMWDHDGIMGKVDDDNKKCLVSYHLFKDTLIISRDNDGEINGVLMFYRYNAGWDWGTIDRWTPDEPTGKDLVVGWMHSQGGAATKSIVGQLKRSVQDWEDCNLFGLRKGKKTRYDKSTFSRILAFNN